VSLASLGGYVSGTAGNLTFSLTENDFTAPTAPLSGGRVIDGAVTAGVATAADVQIFTREGRHVAGTAQSDTSRASLQAMMTEANGFNVGAVYVGDYLNQSGDSGYLGIETTALYGSNVLVSAVESAAETRVTFTALEGIDTNESSVDGLSASAATVGYSMTVGPLSASIGAADIDGPGADDVAAAMLRELRNTAPIATLVGLSDATPLANDSVRLSFEGQIYTVTMADGEPLVSGGEAGRLNAFFDADKRLNIVSTAGTVSRSSIEVVAGVGDEANVAAARRFGLMYQEQHIPTRFSGEITSIAGTAAANTDTVVTLSFDRDDVYNLGFVFDGKSDIGPNSASDMAFSLSNLVMSGGDASAIAAAINTAVAGNQAAGDGGADMTALVSATSIGNLVMLRLKDGLGVDIQSVGGTVSAGDGTVDITSFVEATTTSFDAATAALQFEEGRIYKFKVNGHQIEIDTTPAGLRAATNGDLAGAISDAEAAIGAAIEATSGLGTSTVSSASSVAGSTVRMDLTDATGTPIVISDFQQVTRGAIAAGSLMVQQDITANSTVQIDHGSYLTTDGQSGSAALSIADGATGSIAFSAQTQRFSFTIDLDGSGTIAGGESFVIDGVKGDFASQLATVASDISAATGISATVVNGALQITNARGDGTALAFGTVDAMASDAVDAVSTGDAYFKSSLPAGGALDLDTDALSLTTGASAMSTGGMMATATAATPLSDSYTVPAFDLRRDGDQIIVVPDDGADMPTVTTDASSLARQRYTLSNLPGEDLIMIVGDAGARRLSVQYDMLPEAVLQPQRDIEIKVTDVEAGEVTFFDVETGTSLATRILDDEQAATALDFAVGFTGRLASDDEFLISGNRDGIGDSRNMDQLLQLQSRDLMGAGSGGFQKVFSATVAKLGAVVQSGTIAADAAIALRDASLEAEAEYTGVNLDTEAANLIEQQQAYQASARILATARELFDTLLQSV